MSYQTLTLDIINNETAESIGTTTLNLKVKENGANYLIHKALTIQKANSRDFNASTKTRAEVRGGGRKPWKQKGLGRARAGSNRSPLWKGGGVIFGPKPKKCKLRKNCTTIAGKSPTNTVGALESERNTFPLKFRSQILQISILQTKI